MEEDLKILEERVTTLKRHIKNYEESDCKTNVYQQLVKECRALENLLTRYKEMAEENRGLKIFKEMTIYRLDVIEPRELISKSKIEEQIKWLDNDIKNTKTKMKEEQTFPNYLSDYRKARMKAFITKSKEIKERLQDLIGKDTD